MSRAPSQGLIRVPAGPSRVRAEARGLVGEAGAAAKGRVGEASSRMTMMGLVGEANSRVGAAMGPAGDGGNNRVAAATGRVGEASSRTTMIGLVGEAGSGGAAMGRAGEAKAGAQDQWADSSE